MITTTVRIIVTLVVLSLIMAACQAPPDISGQIAGVSKKGTTLYLLKPPSLRSMAASYFGDIIDSAVVNPDGKFAFQQLPTGNGPIYLELAIKQDHKAASYLQTDDPSRSNYMPIVWQTGESLVVSAAVDEFQKSFNIENPSDVNQSLLQLRDVHQEAYQQHLAGKEWDIQKGSGLLDKEHAKSQFQSALMGFADNTDHFIPAMVAMRWVSPENYYERVPEFLVRQCELWQERQLNHPWVTELCEISDPAQLPVLIGDEFPNLSSPSLDRDTIEVYHHLGERLTIIDLWASWCAPCRKENRTVLAPLWDQYHRQGLQIIAYGLESDASRWRAAVERDSADRWLHASELQGDDAPFLAKLRVQTIPANFILNEKGVVIAKNLHGNELIDFVNDYLTVP